jgi:hypothetical protein
VGEVGIWWWSEGEHRWERERKGRVRESAVARLASKGECERDSEEREWLGERSGREND